MILVVDHDVLGFQIAVYHAVAMDVVECIGDMDRDFHRALDRKFFPLLVQNLPEEAALHPLHHHVKRAAIAVGKHLHDTRVIELLADFALAMKTVEKHRVGFHLRMRDLDGDLASVAQIGGSKDGGHAAAGDQAFNAVMIELVAGMECHALRGCARENPASKLA